MQTSSEGKMETKSSAGNAVTARGLVPTNDHVLPGTASKLARNHPERAFRVLDAEERFRRVAIKLLVNPTHEIRTGWIGHRSGSGFLVDGFLDANVGARLELEITPVVVDLFAQRPLDLTGTRVVPLDEVRVVAVHDPDEPGQITGRACRQCACQLRRAPR
jgi:hypothetical protein